LIVVDASALVDFLVPAAADPGLDRRLLGEDSLHAPHLVGVEVANALRRLTARGLLTDDRARDALLDLDALPVVRYAHEPLLGRAWQLRNALSIPDAVYVALAEALESPLVTCDGRLARAPGIRAAVELFA
jgi:predicted nucleic acid-binding protein